MKRAIEALLIATDRPLPSQRIAEIVGISEEEVRAVVENLNHEYHDQERAFEIKEVAGGYQIFTLPAYAPWVGRLHERKEKLSRAALETLAIVAYHQPITRGELEKTRRVDSSWILESLLEKGLIKTSGRVQAPGRPIKYTTTQLFLRYFGIKDLSELPREEDFGRVASESIPAEPVAMTDETTAPIGAPGEGPAEDNDDIFEGEKIE